VFFSSFFSFCCFKKNFYCCNFISNVCFNLWIYFY
jgi:hypothetical protein